jgi:hypothetical protein
MTSAIIIITLVLCASGIGLFAWSLFDTRKKYYNEYISRKKQ